MSKNSFYFSHDFNARNDEKILAVRMALGAEGYGIYFMLLEKLVETEDRILLKDYNRLAFDLRVASDKIKLVVEDFGLFHFTDDGKRFYSESLLRRMQPLDNMRKQRSQAGKASAEKRQQRVRELTPQTQQIQRSFKETSTVVERSLPKNSTEKVKESKVNVLLKKEPKEIYMGENENFSNLDFLEIENSEELKISEEKTSILNQEKKEKISPPQPPLKKSQGDRQEKKFDFKKALLEFGFDQELVDEWLKIRKAKKAVNTELALKNFIKETQKTQADKNEILNLVVKKQWRGFEAQWWNNTPSANESISSSANWQINKSTNSTNDANPNITIPEKIGRTPIDEVIKGATGWGRSYRNAESTIGQDH